MNKSRLVKTYELLNASSGSDNLSCILQLYIMEVIIRFFGFKDLGLVDKFAKVFHNFWRTSKRNEDFGFSDYMDAMVNLLNEDQHLQSILIQTPMQEGKAMSYIMRTYLDTKEARIDLETMLIDELEQSYGDVLNIDIDAALDSGDTDEDKFTIVEDTDGFFSTIRVLDSLDEVHLDDVMQSYPDAEIVRDEQTMTEITLFFPSDKAKQMEQDLRELSETVVAVCEAADLEII